MPQTYRVRNWKSYNSSLKKRGDIFLYFDQDILHSDWHFSGNQKPGGKRVYSDLAIEMVLTLKHLLRMPLRQTQGFVESFMRRLGFHVQVPNYSTLSRRAGSLDLKIKQYGRFSTTNPLHIAIDSTGLSIYSGTYFHTHEHLKNRVSKGGQSWKKLHVALDIPSGQAVCTELSHSGVQDAAAIEKLTNLPGRNIASIRADKAYDRGSCYRRAFALGAVPIIPPIKRARLQRETRARNMEEEALLPRDEAITFIREHSSYEEGSKEWKEAHGYHLRSHIETFNHRFKRAFGWSLNAKHPDAREVETQIKVNILNKQASLGIGIYEKVA